MPVKMQINGQEVQVQAPPASRLLDVLRVELGLKGAKEGCGEGECGACAVLVNGQVANSCLIPLGQMEGAEIVTIEGVPGDSPLIHSFHDCAAAQCGICTPGMILAATALLAEYPQPTMDEIRWGLSGNLCRCTGYGRIYEAVTQASAGDAHG